LFELAWQNADHGLIVKLVDTDSDKAKSEKFSVAILICVVDPDGRLDPREVDWGSLATDTTTDVLANLTMGPWFQIR